MRTRMIVGFAIALLLSGCASGPRKLSQQECQVANWETIGVADGEAGQNAGYIAVHRDACAPFGVVPDLDAYQAGYVRGVARFCTEDSGYNEGVHGRKNQNACPREIAEPFLRGYTRGYQAYLEEREYRRLQQSATSKSGALEPGAR